jgi:chromosome segregation ATPase
VPNNFKMPWESALYQAVARMEDRLAEARRHYAELQADLAVERARLAECRGRLENWKLRQQAWQRERAELLARLGERDA